MYYNDYDDYMKSVLGYPNTHQNTYDNNYNWGMYDNSYITNRSNSDSNIVHMYPEIYKVINPMVCRMCDNNTQPISEYLIEQMTDDIYDNVASRAEIQNVINVSIGTREISEDNIIEKSKITNNISNSNLSNISNSVGSRSTSTGKGTVAGASTSLEKSNISNNINQQNESQKVVEERETRSPQPRRNTLLRDLIRILILNRFTRPQRPPIRPPFRPGPGGQCAPGFHYCPVMPGEPGPRPPMQRDNYESNDYMPYM